MTAKKSTTKQANRMAARDRAAAVLKRERRRRTQLQAAAAVAVLALTVGIGIAVQSQRNSSDGPAGSPTGMADSTGFASGRATAKVTVEIYEDFQCPACANLEDASGDTLSQFVDAGTVRVIYRPLAFLDRASTTKYSTRSLNAAGCASDAGAFLKMHDLLFANQPAEGTAGLSDAKLIDFGRQAGASGGTFEACVKDQRYEAWTKTLTEAASKSGINGTPTVKVNGTVLAEPSPDNLKAAIEAAGK